MFEQGIARGGYYVGRTENKTIWAQIANGEAANLVDDASVQGFRHMFRLGREELAVINLGFAYRRNLPIRTKMDAILTRFSSRKA